MDDFTPTVEDVRAAFGLSPDVDEDESTDPSVDESQETDENSEDIAENTEGADAGNQTEGEQKQQTQQQAAQPHQNQNQANQAFARMRTENAQMQKTIQMMAQVLGVDPNMPASQLAAALQDQATNALAKQQNIDPAILKRLDQLEGINAQYQQAQLELKAKNAFMNIQEKFHATNQDLQAFVNGLVEEGYDMSAPGADLEQEFIKRNFDAIMQYKIDEAVRAEQNRSTKASGASKPSTKQGKDSNNDKPHDINTVEDLNQFFRDNNIQ